MLIFTPFLTVTYALTAKSTLKILTEVLLLNQPNFFHNLKNNFKNVLTMVSQNTTSHDVNYSYLCWFLICLSRIGWCAICGSLSCCIASSWSSCNIGLLLLVCTCGACRVSCFDLSTCVAITYNKIVKIKITLYS